jgi:hypothetical protein
MKPRTGSRKFKTISRRELLKLTPVLALGAFAIPQLQRPLLKAASLLAIGRQQGCSAPGIWHRRLPPRT